MTETEWALAHGRTQSHVGAVVRGERNSDRLMHEIAEFISGQERSLARRLVTTAA